MEDEPSTNFTITGCITDRQGQPQAGVMVQAHVRRVGGQDYRPLGTAATTDHEGCYAIGPSRDDTRLSGPPAGREVLIRAFVEEQQVGESQPHPLVRHTVIDLVVDPAHVPAGGVEDPHRRVRGVVRDRNAEPMGGVTVEAFDQHLRRQQLLGTSLASADGRYEIRYERSQLSGAPEDSADIVVKVLDAHGGELYHSPVHFDAPADLELNVDLAGTPYTGPSRWEGLSVALTPLLEELSPLDLREDDQHQDVTFLAGEIGADRVEVSTWIDSFRLADAASREAAALAPEVFFGFLRNGEPAVFDGSLLADSPSSDRIALREDAVLRGLTAIAPTVQRSLLEKAVAENVVPARLLADIPVILEMLARLRLRYAGQATVGAGKGTVNELLALTPAARPAQTAFLAAFAAHTGPLPAFWKKLEHDKVMRPEVIAQVRLSFELGALTRNHVPLVAVLVDRFSRGALKAKRELAKFDIPDWLALLRSPGPDGTPVGVPANIDGATPEARTAQFAAILDRELQRSYPTTALGARMGRAADSPVKAKADVVRFLENNPGFHLDRFRVDHYIADHPDALAGIQSSAAMISDLKSIQRVFKLRPTYHAVDALLTRKIDSAQQIYFMGETQLVTTLADSGIGKIQARGLYAKAENVYALALAMFGEYNAALNGVSPAAVPTLAPDPETQARVDALPNLQTLFGSLDYCECTYCRSVYSPAAYFVDVLHFLSQRGTHGTTANAGKTVAQVLLERRPDLGEIELSCENTNTPLPYIDLVNEILEDVVAAPAPTALNAAIEPDLVPGKIKPSVHAELAAKGIALAEDAEVYAPDSRGQWVVRDAQHAYKIFATGTTLRALETRQTFLSAAELRANPEYTNLEAYKKLKQEVFPLNLPFDLDLLESRTYLDHLGVPQPRLLELFQQKLADDVTLAPTDLQIDSAWLGISETERAILTGTLAGRQDWEFWGLTETGNDVANPENPADPTENVTGTWIDVLSSVNVMLNRSGLSYTELLQLLDMKYVNPDGAIFIFDAADKNASNCDTAKFTIRSLSAGALSRMHRFIRLWRKLDWTMWELDILLPDTHPAPGVVAKQITEAALQAISRMNRLRGQTDLDWRVVHSLTEGIDNTVYVDRGQDGAPRVQTLYERLFRNKLVDAVASFPATPDQLAGPIAARVAGLLAAFRIKEADLTLILDDLGLASADNLDASVLGRVHRITALARALGLTVDAFLRLKRLWGHDPFADPGATSKFAELAAEVAASSFSVLELDYLLAHRFTASSGVALDDKSIVALVTTIREGLRKITDDLRLKTDAATGKPEETTAAYVKSKAGRLPALHRDADQVIAIAIIDGTWMGPAADRAALIGRLFAGVLDPPTAVAKLGPLPAGLSPADAQIQVDLRFDYVQPELQAFLLGTTKRTFIRQQVADAIGLDVPSTTGLLDGLTLPGGPGTLLASIDDPRLLEMLPDGQYKFAGDEASFPAIFKSLRLLHKDALMISKLMMPAVEVAWWLAGTRATDMGWMHPKDFPIDTTTHVDISQWLAMERFFAWKTELPPADLTALEFASRVLDATTSSAANLADLARLTAWDPADIATLAAKLHWIDPATAFDVIKAQLKRTESLVRLSDCMRVLHRLGVTAARAVAWATASPTSADADSLKQTVKAKYDLPQWLAVIAPLQDELREHKRDALVGWLIAHPNQAAGQTWADVGGVYNHYLIDVEMSACMLTSRLKQAAGSAQLFVQRCLLNLERDILASTDLDSKWKQWKWMKHFRVWEANRKVFLYPENWIEPELRDEKSPFFKDLENELMQTDITSESAEDAYLNYLEKLDKVADLEIRAIHNHVTGPGESTLHVIGRSRSSKTPEYHYRTRINVARWTAWEPVGLDINANLLLTTEFNRRLYLFWPQFVEKADQPGTVPTPKADQASTTIPQASKYWEVRLAWSELKKGKWTPKVLSDAFVTLYQRDATATDLALRQTQSPNIAVRLFDTGSARNLAPINRSDFDVIGRQIDVAAARDLRESDSVVESWGTEGSDRVHRREEWMSRQAWCLRVGPNSQVRDGLIMNYEQAVFFNYALQYRTTSIHSKLEERLHWFGGTDINESVNIDTPTATDAAHSFMLLEAGRPNGFTVVDSEGSFDSNADDQFFYWDKERTYFVEYHAGTQSSYYTQAPAYSGGGQSAYYFAFYIHYHPFVALFIKELNIWGIKGLLNRRIQVDPASVPGSPALFDFNAYAPNTSIVQGPGAEIVDFTYAGAYAPYNWELFFHVPLLLANRLSANQRFEEALQWFHYIFDPTSTDTATAAPDTPQQRFWITKPFYETTKADYYKQKIENIMLAIAKGDAELRKQVAEWRDHPFKPHLIARMRTVAYQKTVLIKYIQTLIAWGDQVFRQDTIEALNEATQLYVLAASILGPRPKSVPKRVRNPVKTFYQLTGDGIDDFGNSLKEVENLLAATSPSGTSAGDAPELPRLDVLYFCIPNNEKLLTLWDTVADRLFKIRHCMNIEGVVRQLPLFEPPIDPALLVKAAAAGLDIGTALGDLSAPLPIYRFTFLAARAQDVCNEVKALGSAMLAALERRDAEAFAVLRSSHELSMLDRLRMVKVLQVDEETRTWEGLQESRKVVEARQSYHQKLLNDGWNAGEKTAFGLAIASTVLDAAIAAGYIVSGGLKLIPAFLAGAAGFGGSPTVSASTGGQQIGDSAEMAVRTMQSIAAAFDKGAALASTTAGYARRADDWDFQKTLADRELPQVDKQIAAADIRVQVAAQELVNHDKQREDAQSENDYLHSKFTDQELYDWMVTQVATVYFQSYQLAYDLAKRAERCFRYELGLSDSSYIQFGYWDSLRKGLLSGERLSYDLKRLEAAYYEQNRREYELTKHVSLAQLDPVALVKLRRNGECFIDIPEAAFDMDFPGHYFRRLKTVGMSMKCTVGPYTTVACTLTLVRNSLRKDSTLLAGKYPRDPASDLRFRDDIAAIQSVATSSAEDDKGLFELNFRDERYLPFEGAGAISSWHIKLNKDLQQFDLASVADVILHLSYTAREGGEGLRAKAVENFNKTLDDMALAESRHGLFRVFDLKREYPDKWHQFLHPASPTDDQAIVLTDLADRLPYFTRGFATKKAREVEVLALMKDGATYKAMLSPLGVTPADLLSLSPDPTYKGLHRGAKDLTGSEIALDAWTLKIRPDSAVDFKSLAPDAVRELFVAINYTIA